jgi:hypothetical protein
VLVSTDARLPRAATSFKDVDKLMCRMLPSRALRWWSKMTARNSEGAMKGTCRT